MTTPDGAFPNGRRSVFDRLTSKPPAPKPWAEPSAWNIPDVAPDDLTDPMRPLASLVSFHYIRSAVRRRWLRCLLPGALGLLLAFGYLVMSPSLPTATTTLMLTHPGNVEPSDAIATDMSLLTTRAVAQQTIGELGQPLTPEQILGSVTPVATGSTEILQVTMTGPSIGEAEHRLDIFTQTYLDFRAHQIGAQADTLIAGYQRQLADLRSNLQEVTKRIQAEAAKGETGTDSIIADITERSRVNAKISDLEDLVQESEVQRASVLAGSRVIDAPAPLVAAHAKGRVLTLASGLIVGIALGFSLVVLQAILSDRLWLRVEVSSALETPVLSSARRMAPPSRLSSLLGFVAPVRRHRARRRVERQRVAAVIEQALPERGRPILAIMCLGNAREMGFGVVAAAAAIERDNRPALIVDLTERGVVQPILRRLEDVSAGARPEVFRPSFVPSLAHGPAELDAPEPAPARGDGDAPPERNGPRTAPGVHRLGRDRGSVPPIGRPASSPEDGTVASKRPDLVTLVLADLDPAVGVEHLTTWTNDVLIAVTAGRSSVELLRTAGDLVRSAGLHLTGAVLLRAARDDVSSGVVVRDSLGHRPSDAGARPVDPDRDGALLS